MVSRPASVMLTRTPRALSGRAGALHEAGLALAAGQPDDAWRSLGMLTVNLFGLLGAEIIAFTAAKHLPWLKGVAA
jgi:hypothetical protein